MSTTPPERSDEELRSAYEQEIRNVRVEHILIDGVVTLINLGMRRTGLMPGSEGERDPEQVHLAIEAVRAHAPLVESVAPEHAKSVRDALAQLQLAYVRIGGQAAAGAAGPADAGPAAAPRSGEPLPGRGPSAPGSGATTTPPPPPPPPPSSPPPAPKPGEPGPAQRSGRLWIPGS